MNKSLKIWNRDFNLKVVFDCFDNEEITETQKQSIEDFLKNSTIYSDPRKILEYCKKDDNTIDVGSNPFRYVMPKSLYVVRTTDNTRVVAILCDYKFDVEHGIAVIYKNEKFDKICKQDDIL